MEKARILVIAAHPDDEILGGGATFARRAREGDEVHAVIVCEGESIRYSEEGRQTHQQDDMKKAAEVIGFASVRCLMLPEQRLDTISQIDLNRKLETIVDELAPSVVYTHFSGDINIDHRLVHDSVMVAVRPIRNFIREVMAFETPSSTGLRPGYLFAPDTFVDVEDTLGAKLRAMECYTTETPEYPHTRNPESLRKRAAYWGNIVNRKAAEPFITLRRYI